MDSVMTDFPKISIVHPKFGTVHVEFGSVHLKFGPKSNLTMSQFFHSAKFLNPEREH
jgi:hypothetical protein